MCSYYAHICKTCQLLAKHMQGELTAYLGFFPFCKDLLSKNGWLFTVEKGIVVWKANLKLSTVNKVYFL